jgi:hypothetical protein
MAGESGFPKYCWIPVPMNMKNFTVNNISCPPATGPQDAIVDDFRGR